MCDRPATVSSQLAGGWGLFALVNKNQQLHSHPERVTVTGGGVSGCLRGEGFFMRRSSTRSWAGVLRWRGLLSVLPSSALMLVHLCSGSSIDDARPHARPMENANVVPVQMLIVDVRPQ